LANIDPEEAKEIATAICELSKRLREQGKTINGVTGETKRLKGLVGRNIEAKDKDSWLIKAGVALILFPDPSITDLVGGCLIAAGMLKNRNKQLTAADVCKEFSETIKKVSNTTNRLTL